MKKQIFTLNKKSLIEKQYVKWVDLASTWLIQQQTNRPFSKRLGATNNEPALGKSASPADFVTRNS